MPSRSLVLLLVVAAVAAGCVATPPSPSTPPGAHAPLAAGWALDCSLGAVERAVNASWRQECVARASHNPGSKAEMWLAINPTDPNNVVIGAKDLDPAYSKGCVWNGISVTHDGGRSWHDIVIGGKLADRAPTSPYYGYACNTDPDFQFSKDGALHYGVELYGLGSQNAEGPLPKGTPGNGVLSQGYKILLATSRDGGDSFPDVILFQPDVVVVTDYSRMTIDPVTQAIVEAIGSDGGSGCHVLVSKDGGKSAEPFVDVHTPYGPPCNSGAGTAIAASPKGVLTLVGGSNVQGGLIQETSQNIVVRSSDQGRTWLDSNPGFSFKDIRPFKESKYRVPGVLELAYDLTDGPNRGTLYGCYPAADRDEADVFVRSSKDDGKTWSKAVLVNDDAEGAHQWMCNIAVAGDGSVHVFFMDKRYDPAHKLIDITHAMSTDGGASWTNERVTTVSFDGDLGKHQDGPTFIGDYLGVACVKDDCWAGFPDSSMGDVPVTAAAHVHRGSS